MQIAAGLTSLLHPQLSTAAGLLAVGHQQGDIRLFQFSVTRHDVCQARLVQAQVLSGGSRWDAPVSSSEAAASCEVSCSVHARIWVLCSTRCEALAIEIKADCLPAALQIRANHPTLACVAPVGGADTEQQASAQHGAAAARLAVSAACGAAAW